MSYCTINLQHLDLQPILQLLIPSGLFLWGFCLVLVYLQLLHIILSISVVSFKSVTPFHRRSCVRTCSSGISW